MAVRAVLTRFADGDWHNLSPHALEAPVRKALLLSIKVGMAIRRGWMEQRRGDPTWVRLTEAGRSEVRGMWGEDERARSFRMKAEEMRTIAEQTQNPVTKASRHASAEAWDRMARDREEQLEQDRRSA